MSSSTSPGTKPAMRPALRWALMGSACAAAVVAWLPEGAGDGDAALVLPARARPMSSPISSPISSPVAAVADGAAVARMASPHTPGLALHNTGAGSPWPPLSRAAQAAWVPAAPPPRVAAPASAAPLAAPAPPPSFPYQWIGQIDEAGRLRVFLVDARRLWAVAPGETVDPGWRVDGVDANGLQLTWLATGATVQIAAGP